MSVCYYFNLKEEHNKIYTPEEDAKRFEIFKLKVIAFHEPDSKVVLDKYSDWTEEELKAHHEDVRPPGIKVE